MRKILICATLMLAVYGTTIHGQETRQGIAFSGYVKMDAFFDSRQNVAAREGHFLLYPTPTSFNDSGEDVNATPNFNILALQTRLKGTITAPEAFGAKTAGVIEGAFFGHTNADINGFRLRHAFAKLDWQKTSLLLGQYWHPLFVTAVFPGVISFNTGAPFQPFARNPQIRLTRSLGFGTSLMLAALSQRDFASPGGSSSLRNSGIPAMHAQVQVRRAGNIFGGGVDFKSLRPSLESHEQVQGISLIGYTKLSLGKITLKLEGVHGKNLFDALMLGGYAPRADSSYATLSNRSIWGEIMAGERTQIGVFAGYTKSSGCGTEITDSECIRGQDIDSVLRISPRVVWNSGKMRFAVETEYTVAAYGRANAKLEVENPSSVSNLRILFASYLFF